MNGFVKVVKELPPEMASKEPFRVNCSKRKGQFDYVESVLPSLLEHHYISLTPAMSQRRDRYSDRSAFMSYSSPWHKVDYWTDIIRSIFSSRVQLSNYGMLFCDDDVLV